MMHCLTRVRENAAPLANLRMPKRKEEREREREMEERLLRRTFYVQVVLPRHIDNVVALVRFHRLQLSVAFLEDQGNPRGDAAGKVVAASALRQSRRVSGSCEDGRTLLLAWVVLYHRAIVLFERDWFFLGRGDGIGRWTQAWCVRTRSIAGTAA